MARLSAKANEKIGSNLSRKGGRSLYLYPVEGTFAVADPETARRNREAKLYASACAGTAAKRSFAIDGDVRRAIRVGFVEGIRAFQRRISVYGGGDNGSKLRASGG